jgi:ADP-ribose pyrophosphatase
MSKPAANPEVLHAGRFVELVRDGRWEYVRRVNARGAVFVLAITAKRELILVEQYRVPMQARTLELPAGIFGDADSPADETPEACAIRELEEESGWRGAKAKLLLTGPVAPGLTSEILHLVQVENLTRVHAGGGVAGEDITVHLAPLDGIDAWLDAKRGAGLTVEPRIYVGLHFLSMPK